jgi:hypothetical protein
VGTTATRADAAAVSVGASDLFVLRRVGGNQFAHFGGTDVDSAQLGVVLTREWCTNEAARLRAEFGQLDAP